MSAKRHAEAIEGWRVQQGDDSALSLAALHEHLRAEHDYMGSLRSVQWYFRATYAPSLEDVSGNADTCLSRHAVA